MHMTYLHDGYVELVDTFGEDIDIVNAARVSYGSESAEFTERDLKLMNYLWSHQHTSPFRMVSMKFKIKAPIFVLRQWMKHQVGCTWNEKSARYVEVDDKSAFIPQVWRLQHEKSKQSSFGAVSDDIGASAFDKMNDVYDKCFATYQWMLDQGICREQARMVLPVSMYSECIWKADLQAVFNFLTLRLDTHAQAEIQAYAQVVDALVQQEFPFAYKVFKQFGDKNT